jgi:GTP pyrophosphokinase
MTTSSLPTSNEIKLINDQLNELLSMCKNSPDKSKNRIRRAFDLASHAHMGIRRKSGELYIFHPLSVAKIVVNEIGLDNEDATCAALLHDVVEDSEDYTLEDIRHHFGDKVAELVDGLTKIQGVFDKEQSKQAENFKKILLTIVTDINVIIIKIADRLHNMRTLDAMSESKQFQIASETLYFFAPIAYQLGLNKIKTELENLYLKHTQPKAYKEIKEKINKKEIDSETFIQEFKKPIVQKLEEARIKFVISSRFKSEYSIWRKMQDKNVSFEEIFDLFAIRIVFEPTKNLPERTQCWAIYVLITEIYHPKTDRLRDWVGTPKTNGYEALHCTVMSQAGLWVEVQIKTGRMDDIAEKGIAAHWKYKTSGQSNQELNNKWLQQVRENITNIDENAETFINNFKTNMLQPEIYVFTPKGDQRTLTKGATALDFAYEIDTNIGNQAVAAKVNYKLMPLNCILRSADQVEIITTKTQKAKKEWLNIATTEKAKKQIKLALKDETEEHSKKGKKIIDEKLAELGILDPGEQTYKKLVNAYKQENEEELFSNTATGILSLDNFDRIIKENTQEKLIEYWGMQVTQNEDKRKETEQKQPNNKKSENTGTPSTDQPGDKNSFEIAECCKPIPGDEIIGIIMDESTSTVTVHKKKCETATQLAAQHHEKITNIEWSSYTSLSHLAVLEIRGIDRIGILKDLADIITNRLNVNIRKLNVEAHNEIFDGSIELYIQNLTDLGKLITAISDVKGMDSVKRLEQ